MPCKDDLLRTAVADAACCCRFFHTPRETLRIRLQSIVVHGKTLHGDGLQVRIAQATYHELAPVWLGVTLRADPNVPLGQVCCKGPTHQTWDVFDLTRPVPPC